MQSTPSFVDPSTPVSTLEGFRLAGWTVETRSGTFSKAGNRVRVEPKVMGVLLSLVSRPGQVVDRDTIMEQVWPGVIVTDSALSRCISDLRRALGDDATQPHIIETIPKTGYRLLASVEPLTISIDTQTVGGDSDGSSSIPYLSPSVSSRKVDKYTSIRVPILVSVALVLLVGAVAIRSHIFIPKVQAWQGTPQLLTSLPGPEVGAAISPDGSRVAFAWNDPQGNQDIYLAGPELSVPLRLTSRPGFDASPAWSPDGQRVAYLSRLQGEINGGGMASIRIVTVLDGEDNLVLDQGVQYGGLTWSPDSRSLVFSGIDEGGAAGLFHLDLDTGQRRRLTRPPASSVDIIPAFSPNGEQIAFSRRSDSFNGDVHVISLSGGEPERLTFDTAQIPGITWTPDGKSLIVSSDRSGLFSFWKLTPGREPIRVMVPAQDPGGPSIAASGHLAFGDWRFDTNVWASRTGADGFQARAIHPSTTWDEQPALSPDGNQLAWISKRSGSTEIWSGRISGGQPRQLTRFNGLAVRAPSWSPDGSSILFEVSHPENVEIYTIRPGDVEPRRLTEHDADDLNPRWSNDGQHVYFASDRTGTWEIWQVGTVGDSPRQVTHGGGFTAQEDLQSPRLLFTKRSEPGLWAISLEEIGDPGTIVHPVLPSLHILDRSNWSITDRGLFHVDRSTGPPRIMLTDGTETREIIGNLGRLHTNRPAFSASRDGLTIAWGQVDQFESDIYLNGPMDF